MGKITDRFAKPTKIVLLTGLVVAIIIAIVIGQIALEHDPQGEYSMEPRQLRNLILLWFAFVFTPFGVLACVIELVARLMKDRDK
jgi:hypothetical protein